MKVFLDSSVLVSALLSSKGASSRLLELHEAGLLECTISEYVMKEVYSVIQRKFPELKETFDELLEVLNFKMIHQLEDTQLKFAKEWISDANDAPILAAAKKAKVDHLITLDIRHFIKATKVSKLSGLSIVTPAQFFQALPPL